MNPSTKPNPGNVPKSGAPKTPAEDSSAAYARRHLRFGWWSLLVFLVLGVVLEALHGFKVGAYLNVSNQTRRLLWTLAHAHGTLVAVVNIAFAFTVRSLPAWQPRPRGVASASLLGAGLALPAGFFLGGLFTYAGDPGLGILLVPLGGLMLFTAVFLTARAIV